MEFSRRQLNLHPITHGERTGAVGGELSLLDRLDAARLQLRCPNRCRGILDEQVDLGGGLIDRNDEGARAGRDRVGVAELLRLAGADRGEHHDAVIPETHGFGRDIALPAAELSRVGGDAPGPRRPQRVPGDPCRAPKVLELQNLQHFARPRVARARDRREPPGQVNGRLIDRRRKGDDVIDMHERATTDPDDRRGDVREAVVPDADEVGAGAVGIPQLDAIAAARVAARRIDRPRILAGHVVQDDGRTRQGNRVASAAQQHAAAHADRVRLLRGQRRAGAERPDQAATA
ncbi:MAG: hypothetical protein DMD59_10690 [Gemmatimonadetes bacterium]|nr:MAG: hypothetical protein DMD59_10690 [Gemmatimonadota bacterium]